MNKKLNKSDLLLLAVYFAVSFFIQGKDYYENDSMLKEYLFDFPAELIGVCSIIFLFVFWLIPNFVTKKKYILFGILGLLIIIVISGIQYTIGFWTGENDWSKFPRGLDFVLKMIDRGANDTAFPFALLLTKKFYEGQNQLLKFEKQQKENELKLLRSQIDPHFLFNNLNTLDSLIDSDTQRAKEYINRLSLIYRYLIKTKDAEVMELAEEIQLAENYMFLIKTRFGNDYDFKIETTTTLNNKFIPTGAIQALLENVVKHNKPTAGDSIKTVIYIEENALKVCNTKSSIIPKNESFGIGIDNLKARYKLLSDKEVIIINTDKEFSVSIPVIKLIEDN
ncbi:MULTISPECIES: sensor histidine kinase [unclassified Cellulophaga]|uniref:sensor histidine kinase n=1 Tax=unclassified Cellulophaga TaxID=2634405 RepID=UPI0026E2EF3A|nr:MULTISPECIES: histidine kinase [unclassified Cellulophaga]MDO6491347.1 histidine kinase [Cellulophaga sp. 2_MG-2023]MDO6495120.1 histidine kinase [Cellulophaga sp. 3_MG-2023]